MYRNVLYHGKSLALPVWFFIILYIIKYKQEWFIFRRDFINAN